MRIRGNEERKDTNSANGNRRDMKLEYKCLALKKNEWNKNINIHTHINYTHTHTYIYIYIFQIIFLS